MVTSWPLLMCPLITWVELEPVAALIIKGREFLKKKKKKKKIKYNKNWLKSLYFIGITNMR